MKNISSQLKNGIEQVALKRYHYIHKKTAKQNLSSVEKYHGKLDPKLSKLCIEYANDIFGW